MYSLRKLISVVIKDWLDYILLLFLSISLFLIAYSFSLIAWEFRETLSSDEEKVEVILVQGKNFHNGESREDEAGEKE